MKAGGFQSLSICTQSCNPKAFTYIPVHYTVVQFLCGETNRHTKTTYNLKSFGEMWYNADALNLHLFSVYFTNKYEEKGTVYH